MLVVSDASPLNVLIRIGLIDLLQTLYGRVVIPPAVAREMSHASTPSLVREWLTARPPWLTVHSPSAVDSTIPLHHGEREAICLAMELGADLLLVDDLKARRISKRLGLSITGTLGILESAAERDLINLKTALDRIRQTDFSISDDLLETTLRRDAARRRTRGIEGQRSP
jgi:predicted nucleic acid-binding protein